MSCCVGGASVDWVQDNVVQKFKRMVVVATLSSSTPKYSQSSKQMSKTDCPRISSPARIPVGVGCWEGYGPLYAKWFARGSSPPSVSLEEGALKVIPGFNKYWQSISNPGVVEGEIRNS